MESLFIGVLIGFVITAVGFILFVHAILCDKKQPHKEWSGKLKL